MKEDSLKIICRNRKALFEYAIDALYEAGLVLKGTEVKSLRQGKANISDAHARFKDGELYLYNVHINPERPRKLLLNRWELKRLLGKTQEKGYTLIPLRMYFRNEHAKVEIALARGKRKYDKRETIRNREEKRDMERARKRR